MEALQQSESNWAYNFFFQTKKDVERAQPAKKRSEVLTVYASQALSVWTISPVSIQMSVSVKTPLLSVAPTRPVLTLKDLMNAHVPKDLR